MKPERRRAIGWALVALVCSLVAVVALLNERWVLGTVLSTVTLYCCVKQVQSEDM